MCSRTARTVLLVAVVAAAVVLALGATPAVSLASDGVDNGVAETTVGAAAAATDTLPPEGTTAPSTVDLQPMDDNHDGWWDNG